MSNVQEVFRIWYKSKYYKYDLYPKYHQFRAEVEDAFIHGYKAALSEIEKCEPVAEIILDPSFFPALKAPLVDWKVPIENFLVGTELFTSPQPSDGWVLTPNKITDEMEDCWRGYYDGSCDADECYEKMLTKIPTDTKE